MTALERVGPHTTDLEDGWVDTRWAVRGPHGAVSMRITEGPDRMYGSYSYHRPEPKYDHGMEECDLLGECEPTVGSQKNADSIVRDYKRLRKDDWLFAELEYLYKYEWLRGEAE